MQIEDKNSNHFKFLQLAINNGYTPFNQYLVHKIVKYYEDEQLSNYEIVLEKYNETKKEYELYEDGRLNLFTIPVKVIVEDLNFWGCLGKSQNWDVK